MSSFAYAVSMTGEARPMNNTLVHVQKTADITEKGSDYTDSMFLRDITQVLIIACKAQDWSMATSDKALRGLAGYVCGNNDIESAIRVLDKLPEKYAKQIASRLEIYLGYYAKIEYQGNACTIFKHDKSLFKRTKTAGITCTMDALTQGTKKEKIAAYKELCQKRQTLPRDMTSAKIKSLPVVEDKAAKHVASIEKAIKTAIMAHADWAASPSAMDLYRLLDKIGWQDILSSKDKATMAATAGFGGRPKV